ncbi:hypothetical protein GCM10009819_04590 [Agromyces tropicus]|uniref:Uncharacterized protein n=1 Tax=Agromyces tropicus TaxID=555371 RepID=A0ABN2TXS4_9MICO
MPSSESSACRPGTRSAASATAHGASEEGAVISDTRSSDRGVADRSDSSAAANSGGGVVAESDTFAD